MSVLDVVWEALGAYPMVVVVVAFTLDALGIPSIPEISALLVFSLNPTPRWALQLVTLITLIEVAAGLVLYGLARRFGVPDRLSNLMHRYSDMLLIQDERLLLVNRVIPVLPLGAAFIHLRGWNPRRAFTFVALGSIVKYGLLLSFSGIAHAYLKSDEARLVTVVALGAFLVASFFAARERRRRARLRRGGVRASE